jgi:hypothetical protein
MPKVRNSALLSGMREWTSIAFSKTTEEILSVMDMHCVFFEVEPTWLNVRWTSVFKGLRLVTFFALRRGIKLIKCWLYQTRSQPLQKRALQLIKCLLSESEWYKETIIIYEWCPPCCELITSQSSAPCACERTVCMLPTATILQGIIKPFHNSDMEIQKIRWS